MEASFWHQKWDRNEIAFHGSEPNPLLREHFGTLSLEEGHRVFVPLCGKSLDIAWLLANDYRVAGAELNQSAVEQLFADLGVQPEMVQIGEITHYRAEKLDLFLGDIFDVTKAVLGPIDGIYDRAALVALPETMRNRYAAHLRAITDTAPQLLITYEYDQSAAQGPPFSVSGEEVHRHYGESYKLTSLASNEVPGGLRGEVAATEHVWLLAH